MIKCDFSSIILAAGERKVVHNMGSCFMLQTSTASSNPEIAFNNGQLSEFPIGNKVNTKKMGMADFSSVVFRNPSGSSVTLEYIIANVDVSNFVLQSSGVVSVDDTANSIESPAPLAVAAGGAQIIAADSTQKELVLENTGSYTLWVGDSNVDASAKRGKSIEVGDTYIIDVNCAVYLDSETAAGQVSYTRHKKS